MFHSKQKVALSNEKVNFLSLWFQAHVGYVKEIIFAFKCHLQVPLHLTSRLLNFYKTVPNFYKESR